MLRTIAALALLLAMPAHGFKFMAKWKLPKGAVVTPEARSADRTALARLRTQCTRQLKHLAHRAAIIRMPSKQQLP